MAQTVARRLLEVTSEDGARARLQLHLPEHAHAAIYWMPALGVGIGPNETLADALAARGIAVAVHEWRGLGGSDRRASRRCDWGYRELLDFDLRAGLAEARNALPGVRWFAGGHSLGGQFALLAAAQRATEFDGVFLVASGQPHWRAFGGWRAIAVRAFAASIAPLTALAGYFPGTRLRFAGREARTLMREWARTSKRGDYRLPRHGDAFDRALATCTRRVLALRMSEDKLAPPGAIERLRKLAPNADWQIRDLDRADFVARRPDHFGWLREPAPVVAAFEAWSSGR